MYLDDDGSNRQGHHHHPGKERQKIAEAAPLALDHGGAIDQEKDGEDGIPDERGHDHKDEDHGEWAADTAPVVVIQNQSDKTNARAEQDKDDIAQPAPVVNKARDTR